MTVGRVPSCIAPRRFSEFARAELLPVGLEQQLSIPYSFGGDGHREFMLASTGPDFSDEDLRLARRIQALLRLVDRQTAVLAVTPSTLDTDTAGLTGRELAVLRLLAEGHTAVAIGRRLGISPRTVQVHLARVYRKLEVSDRLLAVTQARERGLLAPTPLTTASAPAAEMEAPSDDSCTVVSWRPP